MSSQEAPLSIYIPRVHCKTTRQDLYQVFQSAGLGEVDHVDFVTIGSVNASLYKRAFVHFHHWFNNPSVEELHKKIHNPEQTARLVYDSPWYWILLPNRHPIVENHNSIDLPLKIQKLEDMIEQQTTLLVRMAETINNDRLKKPPVTPSDDELESAILLIRGLIDSVHAKDSCSTFEQLFRFLEQFFDMSLKNRTVWIKQHANQLWCKTPPLIHTFVAQNTNCGSSSELGDYEPLQTGLSDTSSSDNIPVVRLNLNNPPESSDPIHLHVNVPTQTIVDEGVEESKTTCITCTCCGTPLSDPVHSDYWECDICWQQRIEQTLGLTSYDDVCQEGELQLNSEEEIVEGLISSSTSDSDFMSGRDHSTDSVDGWNNISRSSTPDSLPELETNN